MEIEYAEREALVLVALYVKWYNVFLPSCLPRVYAINVYCIEMYTKKDAFPSLSDMGCLMPARRDAEKCCGMLYYIPQTNFSPEFPIFREYKMFLQIAS